MSFSANAWHWRLGKITVASEEGSRASKAALLTLRQELLRYFSDSSSPDLSPLSLSLSLSLPPFFPFSSSLSLSSSIPPSLYSHFFSSSPLLPFLTILLSYLLPSITLSLTLSFSLSSPPLSPSLSILPSVSLLSATTPCHCGSA